MPRGAMATRAILRISTTTRTCSTVCSHCCRPVGAKQTSAWRSRLADTVLARFYDTDGGGFFFTAHDHERLIHRPKPTIDDAMPPGNGVLARALNLLGHLLGETRYLDAASGTLRWARAAMEQYPAGHATLLSALEDETSRPNW